MKVYFSPYQLTPLKKANRLSSMEKKDGVLLKGILGDTVLFADYFPHPELGDRHCDQFLQEFKFQKYKYDQKVFAFLLKDVDYQNLKPKTIYNHQLWTPDEDLQAPVVKYKLQDPKDDRFIEALDRGARLRLDCNGLFSKKGFEGFWKEISAKHRPLIEYVEDPSYDTDWGDLTAPVARDFVDGGPAPFYVYKPNCEFYPKVEGKVIFSSYLGGDLGRWHSYCELVGTGDLKLYHGIVTPGYFSETRDLFSGSYREGFNPDTMNVRRLYQDTLAQPWKLLCSI